MPDLRLDELPGRACGKDGRLMIVRMLGRGSFGAVFEAFDTVKERRYAMKFLLESRIRSIEYLRRFRHEGIRWKGIRHPNLVEVHGLGRQFGMPFIVSEFVEGMDLEEVIAEEQLSIAEAVRIAREIASAMVVIHENEIVHRDLKPTNVMIRSVDRAAKVLDFGMAKYMNSESLLTRPGDVIGTPGFIPPEQLSHGDVTYSGDIFSLGALVYEIVTGKPAIPGADMEEVLQATAKGRLVPLKKHRGEVPRSLARLTKRMLASSPRRRPGSMKEVVDEITKIEAALPAESA